MSDQTTRNIAWQIIEKYCKDYGGFINVITNCGGTTVSDIWIRTMVEYASQQSQTKEIERLKAKYYDTYNEAETLKLEVEYLKKQLDELKAVIAKDIGIQYCSHFFAQKDTYWKTCIHCGFIAPI